MINISYYRWKLGPDEGYKNLRKNLHWSFKLEDTHRGWEYVPNHISKKVSE